MAINFQYLLYPISEGESFRYPVSLIKADQCTYLIAIFTFRFPQIVVSKLISKHFHILQLRLLESLRFLDLSRKKNGKIRKVAKFCLAALNFSVCIWEDRELVGEICNIQSAFIKTISRNCCLLPFVCTK